MAWAPRRQVIHLKRDRQSRSRFSFHHRSLNRSVYCTGLPQAGGEGDSDIAQALPVRNCR